MRVKFLKSIASIYGGFAPGMVADIPNDNIASSWCRSGICEEASKAKLNTDARLARHLARVEEYKAKRSDRTEPDNIPDGQFWCEKHSTLHKAKSPTGQKCLKRIEKEARIARKAEVKAEEAKIVEEKRIAEEARTAEETGKSEEDEGKEDPEKGLGSNEEEPFFR